MAMAWATFTAQFTHDRRPAQAIAFCVPPGTHNLPRDVVDAAVAAGVAREIAPPKKTKQPAAKRPFL